MRTPRPGSRPPPRAARPARTAQAIPQRAAAGQRWAWVLALTVLLVAAGLAWWLWSPAPQPALQPAPEPAPRPVARVAEIGEASVAQLLQGPAAQDWRVHRLRGNAAVLVIEFPGLLAQGEAMNRIAALLEKNGASRDQVLSDAALQALVRTNGDNTSTFYLGHDYEAEGLARFFNLALSQGVRLAPAELRLRQLLLDARLLAQAEQGAEPAYRAAGPGALVSFSAAQADDPATAPDEGMDERRRASVLRHELSHGEFFTNAAYRAHCWSFWRRLSDAERMSWRRYLRKLGYDSANETLMVNEAQALLMHTPDTRDFDAAALGVSMTALEAMRMRFQLSVP